jgi:MazG family protein
MKEFDRLVEVMRRVKTECPWDRKQTHETIRQYFVEETYEVLDAIDSKNDTNLREELGDVLCQVLFHSLLAEERHKFSVTDVCNVITDKLIERHPHVFGDTQVKDSEEVLNHWEHIKMKVGKKESVLDGVPKNLPALTKAYRMQSKASRIGFDWDNLNDVIATIDEELKEFQNAVRANDSPDEIEGELGDLLFSLVNLSRKLEISPEDALRKTIRKFERRFKFVEKTLKKNGSSVKEATLEEMDALWEDAKNDSSVS